MSESELRDYLATDIVRVSKGVRATVLGGKDALSEVESGDLRDAWLVLSAYAADLKAELKKRGVEL